MVILINEGAFQEYDYNNEYNECEWKQHDKTSICTVPFYKWPTCGTQDTGQFINLFEDET